MPLDPSAVVPHAFLFADLRGYTRFVEAKGDRAGAALLDRYREVVRAAVAASGGAEIRTEGDSFFVVFGSATGAVRCGLAIVDAASGAGGPDEPLDVGVGIHAGEAVETPEGFVGSAVNIAARLCAQAAAGEVLVSDTVRSLAHGSPDVSFAPLGVRRLKGVDEPVTVCRAGPRRPDGPAGAPRGRAPARWWKGPVGKVAGSVVLVVAVAAVAWVQAGASPVVPADATPGTTAISGASAPPTAAGSSGATSQLAVAELTLLERIPLEFQPYCHRSTVEDGATGGLASLRCDLRGSPGYGADTVWYDLFDESTRGAMVAAASAVLAREELPTMEGPADGVLARCQSPAGEAVGRWQFGSTFAGQLACWADGGGAWMLWTYEGPDILARAVRTDGDAERLQAWWRDRAADYLR